MRHVYEGHASLNQLHFLKIHINDNVNSIYAADCPLPSVQNGTVLVQNNQFGSITTVHCDTGFAVVGSPTSQCLINGEWSGNKAKCNSKL